MNGIIIFIVIAGMAVFVTYLFGAPLITPAINSALVVTHISEPDKLGWMDDLPLTDRDRKRIAIVSRSGRPNNIDVIRRIQSGERGSITRRDFELIRQDRRRARAAYPEVSEDDLYIDTWLSIDASAKIPASFCTSGNSQGTKIDGKQYLDGGCLVSTVSPGYTERADAGATKRVLGYLKEAKNSARFEHVSKWGYFSSWGGSCGSGRIGCYPDPLPSNVEESDLVAPGKCVVVMDGSKYTFPFIAADWIDPPFGDDIKKLALSRQAEVTPYVPVPEKPWIIKDGSLALGEVFKPGRLGSSMWNGDGYDNADIGPADPTSWVTNGIFGIALSYIPAPDNGEQRSVPGQPWYLVITYYGSIPQVSGGWTEEEAKTLLPKFSTGRSYGMMGQNDEELNAGNLKEARCTQIEPKGHFLFLKDLAMPIRPSKPSTVENRYVQGGILMPGQSCTF